MPLAAYGVAIGNFVSFTRDTPDQFGHWYHGHLTIATPSGRFASALDVDTPSDIGVSYRISRNLPPDALGSLPGMGHGWHPLASNQGVSLSVTDRSRSIRGAWAVRTAFGFVESRRSSTEARPIKQQC
jgi:hypothetical protein